VEFVKPRGGRVSAAGFAGLALASTLWQACGELRAAPPAPRGPGLSRAAHADLGMPVTTLAGAGVVRHTFEAPRAGEAVLTLQARVPGGSWGTKGREAFTARLSIDGAYHQDVVLYAGARSHAYAVSLGRLEAGPHTLTLQRLASHSAPALTEAMVEGLALAVVTPGQPEFERLARSPILVSRPASHLTDTPLLMMVEDREAPDARRLRYTVVFSNEDGGTETHALLARWGRTADIDWAYDVELGPGGVIRKDTYQGAWHLTRDFDGAREGTHPVLRVATDNNCYADGGTGPLRFRPAPSFVLDAGRTAREEILDQNPWAYAIAAEELFREGKAAPDAAQQLPAVGTAGRPVGDPRRLLVAEFHQQHDGRGVGLRVVLKGSPAAYLSSRGDDGLQAARSGWCRVAVELPRRVQLGDIDQLELVGKGRGATRISAVRRVLTFDEGFAPQVLPVRWEGDQWLRSDQDRVKVWASSAQTFSPATP
jgi:hypothetical protein